MHEEQQGASIAFGQTVAAASASPVSMTVHRWSPFPI
jgi:hypothetical protein